MRELGSVSLSGLFLGWDAGEPALSMRDDDQFLRFKPSEGLTISGRFRFFDAFRSNDDAGSTIYRDDTNQSQTSSTVWSPGYEIRIHGTGTVAIAVSARNQAFGAEPVTLPQVRLKRNGGVVGSATAVNSASYTEISWADIAITSLDDVFTLEIKGGRFDVAPGGEFDNATDVNWLEARARFVHAEAI